MTDVLDAFKSAFIAAAPALVAALVATLIAGFTWLQKRLSLVRTEVAASALRQAQELHTSAPAAFQAATDELRKMDPRVQPKDVVQAVEKAVEKDRVKRASMAPRVDADVCGKLCEHDSECLMLKGHGGGHETQHGCIFYDEEPSG